MDFGPNINFVQGPNGSGKSAILASLMLGQFVEQAFRIVSCTDPYALVLSPVSFHDSSCVDSYPLITVFHWSFPLCHFTAPRVLVLTR